MLKIIITGFRGRLGGAICRLAESAGDVEVAAGIDLAVNHSPSAFPVYHDISDCAVKADCIIDCSIASAVPSIVNFALKTKTPVVVCTTGLSNETEELLREASKQISVFRSANMSLGVNLMCALAEKLAAILPEAGFDIEIVERHHNQKLDAPSGTAYMLANAINNAAGGDYEFVYDRSAIRNVRGKKEIGMHAVRGGAIIGEHEVIFAGGGEVLEIKHSAMSKEVFAVGALKAARYTAGKAAGLYDMQSLVNRV